MATRAHTVPRFYLAGFTAPGVQPGHDPYTFVGSISDGAITRRAPKNISIQRGFYDGPGGFEESDASIETHLSKIEWAAASAIKRIARTPVNSGSQVPPEVWRFVAWQAARTPAWLSISEDLVKDWDPNEVPNVVEPPPKGFESMKDRRRLVTLEHSKTGERREATSEEFKQLFPLGWRWVPSTSDRLELIQMQAWYFQVRHFPRLHWRILAPPPGASFITSDRGVTWSADGQHHVPPSALRHPSSEVIAPLTSEVALLGCGSPPSRTVTAEEINARIALSAVQWVAGASEAVVQAALDARSDRNSLWH